MWASPVRMNQQSRLAEKPISDTRYVSNIRREQAIRVANCAHENFGVYGRDRRCYVYENIDVMFEVSNAGEICKA